MSNLRKTGATVCNLEAHQEFQPRLASERRGGQVFVRVFNVLFVCSPLEGGLNVKRIHEHEYQCQGGSAVICIVESASSPRCPQLRTTSYASPTPNLLRKRELFTLPWYSTTHSISVVLRLRVLYIALRAPLPTSPHKLPLLTESN